MTQTLVDRQGPSMTPETQATVHPGWQPALLLRLPSPRLFTTMTACPRTLHPPASVFLCLVPQCTAFEGHLILFIKNLFTFGCTGSSLLHVGFL